MAWLRGLPVHPTKQNSLERVGSTLLYHSWMYCAGRSRQLKNTSNANVLREGMYAVSLLMDMKHIYFPSG
jgi:hypothetical protein